MNITRRTLRPARLALPTLLTLSAMAAWTPTESYAGTGFYTDVDASSTASVKAGYLNPGNPQEASYVAAWRNSSNQQWVVTQLEVRDLDNYYAIQAPITKPPKDWAIAEAWINGSNYAYASVSDF